MGAELKVITTARELHQLVEPTPKVVSSRGRMIKQAIGHTGKQVEDFFKSFKFKECNRKCFLLNRELKELRKEGPITGDTARSIRQAYEDVVKLKLGGANSASIRDLDKTIKDLLPRCKMGPSTGTGSRQSATTLSHTFTTPSTPSTPSSQHTSSSSSSSEGPATELLADTASAATPVREKKEPVKPKPQPKIIKQRPQQVNTPSSPHISRVGKGANKKTTQPRQHNKLAIRIDEAEMKSQKIYSQLGNTLRQLITQAYDTPLQAEGPHAGVFTVEQSLGQWLGRNSEENLELRNILLNIGNDSIAIEDSERAIVLLNKAYNNAIPSNLQPLIKSIQENIKKLK